MHELHLKVDFLLDVKNAVKRWMHFVPFFLARDNRLVGGVARVFYPAVCCGKCVKVQKAYDTRLSVIDLCGLIELENI